jgi:glucose-6-phosphate dehydrogenase assembly protein OpcA
METAVRPERILEDLHQLWVSLGRQSGEEHESGVLRACSMTLIVAADETEDPGTIGDTLAGLMREHPSRAIVLRVRPAGEPFLDARVFAQCWLPLGHRRQICSEQIEITSSHASLQDVPALIRALTAPDLPVVLWCRCRSLFHTDSFSGLSRLADKLIIDSSRFGEPRSILRDLAAYAQSGWLVGDLSWARLTRCREAIAQVFEDRSPEISELHAGYAGSFIPVSAYYMAAWLASALGWEAGDQRIHFDSLQGEEQNELKRVVLAAPGVTISAEGSPGEINLQVDGLLHKAVLPDQTDSALLGEELSIPGHDRIYERTLKTADQIANGG